MALKEPEIDITDGSKTTFIQLFSSLAPKLVVLCLWEALFQLELNSLPLWNVEGQLDLRFTYSA